MEVVLCSAYSWMFAYSYGKPVSETRNGVFIVTTDLSEKPLLPCLATFHPLIPSAYISRDRFGTLVSQIRHASNVEGPLVMKMMSIAVVLDALL